jgi:hypothetical protein
VQTSLRTWAGSVWCRGACTAPQEGAVQVACTRQHVHRRARGRRRPRSKRKRKREQDSLLTVRHPSVSLHSPAVSPARTHAHTHTRTHTHTHSLAVQSLTPVTLAPFALTLTVRLHLTLCVGEALRGRAAGGLSFRGAAGGAGAAGAAGALGAAGAVGPGSAGSAVSAGTAAVTVGPGSAEGLTGDDYTHHSAPPLLAPLVLVIQVLLIRVLCCSFEELFFLRDA